MNSKCTKPNFCECDSGYTKRNKTELNVVPYQNLTDLQICVPICNEGYEVVMNINGTVGTCTEIIKNTLTEIHIIIYSLLICSLILITLAGIFMVNVMLKRNRNTRIQASSWRTSFASYTSH